MPESIFSKIFKTSSQTYFFDVKQAQNGKKSNYMQVTQSWIKEGKPERRSITIFPDQLEAFCQAFDETRAQVV